MECFEFTIIFFNCSYNFMLLFKILVRNGADADCWGPGPEGCLQTLLHK